MRQADWLRLLVLAAIWGGSFIFMRVLAPVLGPVVTADLRVLLAGAVLLAWFAFTGLAVDWRGAWKHYLVIGAINSAIPFTLFAYAALHLPASYSAIFNATAPLFGAVFGALWLAEGFSANRAFGIAFGIGGVVLVSRAGSFTPDADFLAAAIACLVAAACYGLGGVYLNRFAKGVKPAAIAGASQLMAGLLLLPLVPLAPPSGPVTTLVIACVLGLSLLCSGFAYLLYYRLMADVGPTRALTVTFLIPGFGILWSAVFLGERITGGMLAGCGLVLIGTWLVTRGPKTPATASPAPEASGGKSV